MLYSGLKVFHHKNLNNYMVQSKLNYMGFLKVNFYHKNYRCSLYDTLKYTKYRGKNITHSAFHNS